MVIPSYNARETVVEVLRRRKEDDFHRLGFDKEIIIVDDGSIDGTVEILRGLKEKYNILYQSSNQGKGAALRKGFDSAQGDYIVIQDADLEYNPQDIINLLKLVDEKEGVVIYGSRNLNRNVRSSSFFYKWGGQIVTTFFNFFFVHNLTDINTCYKLFPRRILGEINLKENGFAFCEEFTCQVVKRGYQIKEIPISYSFRDFSQGKKLHWWHGFRSLYVILRNRFLL